MAVKLVYFISAVFLAISLTSCATSDPSDDFSFDYTSAEIGAFNGIWEGHVDCRYANGFKPAVWVKISDGRGEFAFGNRMAPAGSGFQLVGSLFADLDLQNGKIKWSGKLIAWQGGDKLPTSFRGYWRDTKFKLKVSIGSKNCSGVITKRLS